VSSMRNLAVRLTGFLLILPAFVSAAETDVYVVPFSHFDLFWAGTKQECLSRGNRIITKAVQLATQYPEFRFLVEDEVWMANYLESHRGREFAKSKMGPRSAGTQKKCSVNLAPNGRCNTPVQKKLA